VAIEIDGLAKAYGRQRALDGIDLEIPTGATCGLLGPQGAGKTTLARLLAGLEGPTAGSARIDGHPIGEPQATARLGYIPHPAGFDEGRTPRQMLRLAGRLHGVPTSRRERRLERLLIDLGLEHLGGHAIEHLDGGHRRRLALAHALVPDPDHLVVDEPTRGLGPAASRRMREALIEKTRERTLLVLTSIPDDVEALCERVVGIEDGTIVLDAGVGELAADHGVAIAIGLAGELPQRALDELREHEAVAALRRDPTDADLELWLTDPDEAPAVLRLLVEADAPVASFDRQPPPLGATVAEHMEGQL
jgi:ABC-2 type transport system ATP-binding protein